ncbi:MAG: hypothetical protein M3O46_08020 [Myxococcota bacterium]|nr:hypothetical protein [Myxococcota bacterium]
MRPPKYPLEPLVELRDKKVDEAVGNLAARARERDAAKLRRDAVEQKREAHESAAEQVRAAEAKALARGELRVLDLGHADAWESRVAAEQQTLASDVENAHAEEERARAAEEAARGDLASRSADAHVVAEDRTRWRDALRRRADSKEEEASSEARRPSKS